MRATGTIAAAALLYAFNVSGATAAEFAGSLEDAEPSSEIERTLLDDVTEEGPLQRVFPFNGNLIGLDIRTFRVHVVRLNYISAVSQYSNVFGTFSGPVPYAKSLVQPQTVRNRPSPTVNGQFESITYELHDEKSRGPVVVLYRFLDQSGAIDADDTLGFFIGYFQESLFGQATLSGSVGVTSLPMVLKDISFRSRQAVIGAAAVVWYPDQDEKVPLEVVWGIDYEEAIGPVPWMSLGVRSAFYQF